MSLGDPQSHLVIPGTCARNRQGLDRGMEMGMTMGRPQSLLSKVGATWMERGFGLCLCELRAEA